MKTANWCPQLLFFCIASFSFISPHVLLQSLAASSSSDFIRPAARGVILTPHQRSPSDPQQVPLLSSLLIFPLSCEYSIKYSNKSYYVTRGSITLHKSQPCCYSGSIVHTVSSIVKMQIEYHTNHLAMSILGAYLIGGR